MARQVHIVLASAIEPIAREGTMALLIQAPIARTSRPVSVVRKDTCAALVRQAAQRTVATLCAERSASYAREASFMAMVRGSIARDANAVKVRVVADVVIPCSREAYLRKLRDLAWEWTAGDVGSAE